MKLNKAVLLLAFLATPTLSQAKLVEVSNLSIKHLAVRNIENYYRVEIAFNEKLPYTGCQLADLESTAGFWTDNKDSLVARMFLQTAISAQQNQMPLTLWMETTKCSKFSGIYIKGIRASTQ